MAWQPHGDLLATGNGDSTITVLNTSSGREEHLWEHDYSPGPDGHRLMWDDPVDHWVFWSPDGRYLASWPGVGCGGRPSVWDSRTRVAQAFQSYSNDQWNSVGWRRDGLMRAEKQVRDHNRIVSLRTGLGNGTVRFDFGRSSVVGRLVSLRAGVPARRRDGAVRPVGPPGACSRAHS